MRSNRSSVSTPIDQSAKSPERKARLARVIRKRPSRVLATAFALALVLSAAVAIPLQMVRWAELNALRTDYERTWCSTFGSKDWDVSYLVNWHEFVERNQEVLVRHLSLDPLFGSSTTVFEVRINGEMARWVEKDNRDYSRIGQQTNISMIFSELNSVARSESLFPNEETTFPECP